MAETKYLYGASVQGIQNFIFQTNELKDIVGASELVEQICTDQFLKLFFDKLYKDDPDKKDDFHREYTDKVNQFLKEHRIIAAAGNVKYTFDNEADCRKAVLEFPKKVMTAAPGITISQAVVEYDGSNEKFGEAVNKLENRLRAQRNHPATPLTTGLLGMERARSTGLPALFDEFEKSRKKEKEKEKIPIDASTKAKQDAQKLRKLCWKSFGKDTSSSEIAFDIKDMTEQNGWIAVIHADGNGLGKVVQKIGEKREPYTKFSQKLDEATKNAAHAAFEKVEGRWPADKRIPIRPVVLGGDDMTAIMRGDLAIDYVNTYLNAFEEQTKVLLGNILKENHVFEGDRDYLTACAGIAFIKESYPFYYGYNLADKLCDKAKKISDRKASCLMFHKVQDSFITNYDDIITRELTAKGDTTFMFGPYFVKENNDYWSIEELTKKAKALERADAGVKSGIRRWLTLLHADTGQAQQHLERLKAVHKGSSTLIQKLTEERQSVNAVPAYDVLALHTVLYQDTNNNE